MPSKTTKESTDIALRRYDSILRYLATDNQIFWTRSQLFLVANATLVGFELKDISVATDSIGKIVSLLSASTIGLILSLFWLRSVKHGKAWVEHWKSALVTWEQAAFGDVQLHRKRPAGAPVTQRVTHKTAVLFLIVWIIVTVYLVICLVLKLGERAGSEALAL